VTGDGKTVAFIGSDAVRPPRPQVAGLDGPGAARPVVPSATPPEFPAASLVTPRKVVLEAKDGVKVHAQLFKRNSPGRRPAIVFLHGGPAQQMLLGWHYKEYYAHAYAMNQYLASRGVIVLSVNYRLGIGYGHAFQFPEQAGARGAGEYEDVVLAGKYLQSQPDVDRSRIGIWGLSYGGYLTSLALGRNSDIFAAGVDVHGVHEYVMSQIDSAAAIAAEKGTTPVPWRSPVLLIHSDDDRNVSFVGTVEFEQLLASKGIPVETRVIPDDVHDFLLFRSWATAASAMVDFFERKLLTPPASPSRR
jgi:dipeptidyl aminopeptidase/acylaminoacyl peptidase